VLRLDALKSEAVLESVLSRESSFLFNNMVLVGIAATVLLLTTFPLISEAVTSRKVTMGPPIFNLVNIPWALALLFLVGVGPLIAWRKATAENLRRNFVVPGLAGLWTLILFLALEGRAALSAAGAVVRAIFRAEFGAMFDALKTFYPPVCFGLAAFVLATVLLEFWRGVRARRHQYGEDPFTALALLVWRNKRRWGGYVVHVGFVVLCIGVAASSAYRKEVVEMVAPRGTLKLDGYAMVYEGYRLEAIDDHIAAVTEVSVWQDDRFVARLEAEQRSHPNMLFPELKSAFERAKAMRGGDAAAYHDAVAGLYTLMRQLEGRAGREVKTPSTEVAIHKSFSLRNPQRFAEDFYVTPLGVDPFTGQANFRVFVNPLINFLWFGGFILVVGSAICVLPDARERKRLAIARALEERAAA
jgi:cytochrome c-type biogenesis protein CcmF